MGSPFRSPTRLNFLSDRGSPTTPEYIHTVMERAKASRNPGPTGDREVQDLMRQVEEREMEVTAAKRVFDEIRGDTGQVSDARAELHATEAEERVIEKDCRALASRLHVACRAILDRCGPANHDHGSCGGSNLCNIVQLAREDAERLAAEAAALTRQTEEKARALTALNDEFNRRSTTTQLVQEEIAKYRELLAQNSRQMKLVRNLVDASRVSRPTMDRSPMSLVPLTSSSSDPPVSSAKSKPPLKRSVSFAIDDEEEAREKAALAEERRLRQQEEAAAERAEAEREALAREARKKERELARKQREAEVAAAEAEARERERAEDEARREAEERAKRAAERRKAREEARRKEEEEAEREARDKAAEEAAAAKRRAKEEEEEAKRREEEEAERRLIEERARSRAVEAAPVIKQVDYGRHAGFLNLVLATGKKQTVFVVIRGEEMSWYTDKDVNLVDGGAFEILGTALGSLILPDHNLEPTGTKGFLLRSAEQPNGEGEREGAAVVYSAKNLGERDFWLAMLRADAEGKSQIMATLKAQGGRWNAGQTE